VQVGLQAFNKFGNIKRALFSPPTAISVHFLEKKTIDLRLGSDYRLFGDSLCFAT